MASPMKAWTCTICGEHGLEPGNPAARKAYLDHYLECHQEVPF